MSKKIKRALMKTLDYIATTISILGIAFVIWVAASVIDVNNHNLPTDESLEKASWNIFEIIAEKADAEDIPGM